jgi:hypothetical protein
MKRTSFLFCIESSLTKKLNSLRKDSIVLILKRRRDKEERTYSTLKTMSPKNIITLESLLLQKIEEQTELLWELSQKETVFE